MKAIIKCPHCGGLITPDSKFRRQLIKLADGTRTVPQIVALTKHSRYSVYGALRTLKRLGADIKVKAIYKPRGARRGRKGSVARKSH